MALTIGAVVLRVQDLDRTAAFWRAALDHLDRRAPEEDWISLRPREGDRVNESFDLRRSHYGLPPRFHLDLYAEHRSAEVERLVGLGARVIPLDHAHEVDWILMEDPEGNRFDVASAPRS